MFDVDALRLVYAMAGADKIADAEWAAIAGGTAMRLFNIEAA